MESLIGPRLTGAGLGLLVLSASCAALATTAPRASAQDKTCVAIASGGSGCSLDPAADGARGGASVLAANALGVGHLDRGLRFVFCRAARGATPDQPFTAHMSTCAGSGGPPTPRPGPRPGSVLPEPVNPGSYGTYHFRYQLWRNGTKHQRANFTDWTPAQMMTQLNSNFSHYFTFTGCGRQLHVGDRCSLATSLAPDGRVQVIAVAPDGFAVRSLGGHPEGSGRTIRFQFQTYTNEAEISSRTLVIDAWGPLGASSLLGRLNAKLAEHIWGIFADNVKSRFPSTPPGGVRPCPSCPVSV
ncbi:MAG: hypothetical protein QOH12_3423 [Solirubrobacteraceae bacterium]|jgi:hypothetical protein|nr:hypothetical protein [Solirubrobacteraceae bacterium]